MNDETPAPTENEDPRAKIWEDDVLDRRGFADFLTNALTEQTRAVSERQQRGLTVALDAGWGTGKTFFVKHWADDLKARGHPVVYFDAWENDLGEEAAIALMAAIKETIDEWVARMPVKQEMQARANEMVRQGVKQLRRAVVPVSKVMGAAVLKKVTGIGVKEVFDAFDGEDALPGEKEEVLSEEKIEAGLDKVFESALGEQRKRTEAIKNFKVAISKALILIDVSTEAVLPLYVFVDELDRCRPSYSIQLLEEIKHVFGIPNVCFVVSTNLEQLSHSTRAVYGFEFDANGYLKRFYDQGFSLPDPNNIEYVSLLIEETISLKKKNLSLGLPRVMLDSQERSAAFAVSTVLNAFNLDLRSQKQVFVIADAVAASIENDKKIFLIWLFFLAALFHKKPDLFKSLADNKYSAELMDSILESTIKTKIEIGFKYAQPGTGRYFQKQIGLDKVIGLYYKWANQEAEKIYEDMGKAEYPWSNLTEVYREFPSERQLDKKYYPTLSKYMNLVKYAGYLRDSTIG